MLKSRSGFTLTHNRPYTTCSSRYLWQSRWYNVRQDQLRAHDGSEMTYTVIEKTGAIWIVPVTPDEQIVLIDQYRYAVDEWCLEVPAGNVEPGIAPVVMAARELSEEICGTAEKIVYITDFFTMNGIGNEIAQVFLALDVTLGEAHREATEHITLRAVPVDQAFQMARAGDIKDGPSALAILLCEGAICKHVKEQHE